MRPYDTDAAIEPCIVCCRQHNISCTEMVPVADGALCIS